ncbi:unnamed protein product, partial [Rangifer tarandus platyrhynchus]
SWGLLKLMPIESALNKLYFSFLSTGDRLPTLPQKRGFWRVRLLHVPSAPRGLGEQERGGDG